MRNKKGQFSKGNPAPKHKEKCNCFRCTSEPRKLQGKYISCFYCKKPVYRELNQIRNFSKVYCNNNCRFPKVFNTCQICNKKYRVKPSHAKERTTCGSQECVTAYRKTLPAYWTGKERISMIGKNNWNWRNGITPINYKIRNSLEYKKWRRKVFIRDNFTCVICNQKGGILEADHIKPFALYPELRFVIDNGRTLCHDCHVKTDTYGANVLYLKRA